MLSQQRVFLAGDQWRTVGANGSPEERWRAETEVTTTTMYQWTATMIGVVRRPLFVTTTDAKDVYDGGCAATMNRLVIGDDECSRRRQHLRDDYTGNRFDDCLSPGRDDPTIMLLYCYQPYSVRVSVGVRWFSVPRSNNNNNNMIRAYYRKYSETWFKPRSKVGYGQGGLIIKSTLDRNLE
ncbi:hypothetical protein AGLY_008660 [Aphis glycines]|uniref:Uncharacterized protein n=1 Tax=Aphis glycines TaxID=307491 RepID=A0A6G0TL74_APHGL|nr:hypothetical protein AGLY_008660 [Aphis glycines]